MMVSSTLWLNSSAMRGVVMESKTDKMVASM
jgi:hypothetical protein